MASLEASLQEVSFLRVPKKRKQICGHLCESCPRLKGITTSQDQVQVTNAGATVAVISFGSLQVKCFLAKVVEIYPGGRRLVEGHQLQPGHVLGPRSKSLPGPWTTSLCLKGVESESDDI